MHATVIREHYLDGTFERHLVDTTLVPHSVSKFLFDEFIHTKAYTQLRSELEHVRNYKKAWEVAPYPVKHMTVDAVVEQSGHVLLVKRKAEPGKGLWAIPGGHLNMDETTVNGAIRELYEETKIKIPKSVLRGSIVAKELFDDPHRSTIGRVITHAFHFKLADDVVLPKVKGADDAEKAVWKPISELKENEFFDDHYFIIAYFLGL
jgi:bifunctional NMN adenylyltransferase/nudix hydrolase